MKETTNTKRN